MVLAPHIFVEDVTVANIEQARAAYLETDLPKKLGRYHDDVDSAFWGWNRIWLHPPFEQWNIEAELDAIRCPVLAVQGIDDEYGTLAQIRGIAAARAADRSCWSCPTAGIRRIATSPKRSGDRSFVEDGPGQANSCLRDK